jgi:phosphomannomutase/phosphoglucomutase
MTDHIFREYDIRGVVETDLTESTVLNLGKAIGTYLLAHGIKEMVVGRDCRLSSENLNKSLIKGLLSTGIDVVDLGICHSPLLYFSLFHLNKNGGVMITGSHNPPEFNGFKICRGKTTIHGSEIQKLKEIINKNSFSIGSGNLSHTDILPAYWDTIAADIKLSKELKVVIDAGNGTGGRASVELLKRLGCDVKELYCDMDGNFPNHHPDPTVPACLADLIETVKREKADLGIGYDGDADRIGAVDEKGNIIWGDQLLTIFAREILKESPGATFISEVKASQNFYNDINQKGGKAIMWKTGHSLIKAKMKEENALLAGEMSGHMFFAHRYFGFDDAVYATCRLLEILSTTNAPLSSLLSDLPKTFTTPEIRVDCPDSKKFEITEKVKTHFKKSCETIDIDGVRILMKDGWGLVRSSNTQPVLVLRFEANTKERLDEIKEEVETVVKSLIS